MESPKPYPEMAGSLQAQSVSIARTMSWRGTPVAAKDVIFLDYDYRYLSIVVACLAIDGAFGLVIRYCRRIRGTDTASCWRVDKDPTLYRLTSEPILQVSFWRFLESGDLEILV